MSRRFRSETPNTCCRGADLALIEPRPNTCGTIASTRDTGGSRSTSRATPEPPAQTGSGNPPMGVTSVLAENLSRSGMGSAARCRTSGALAPNPHMPMIIPLSGSP
jgi:hypothetical protein